MTRRALAAAALAISLAALIARTVAVALTDLDRGLRNIHLDTIPNVIPLWMDEEANLP